MEIRNHEYYVSFEIAKLLKKAGFDWKQYSFYNSKSILINGTFAANWNDKIWYIDGSKVSAPTLDVAQRWLREVKGICLTVQPLFDKVNEQFNVVVGFTPFLHRMDGEMIIVSLDSENTYKEAQEAGIKKALEIILEKGE